MENQKLIPHLFRTEYRKIISVLCKAFGIEHIEIAEDIVSETFLLASETWGLKGLPPNPTAWLYTVSKNKTKDFLKRNAIFTQKIYSDIKNTSTNFEEIDIDLSTKNIDDSQLQMMFAICHPSIPKESQISLCLNILCGFGAEEISDGFLIDREAAYKRLRRGKEQLRKEKVAIELPDQVAINKRLEVVLTTLYLLFNEGYYSVSKSTTLRKDLCVEAMRLNLMLVENEQTNIPAANALLSLMCFHSSRFDARTNEHGELILYEDQDENLWNEELIEKGKYFLNQASSGKKLSKYHLEAAIAYWHTHKNDSVEKWGNILKLYNRLLQIEYSPIAALNRTYALSKAKGKKEAIAEAEKLNLNNYHFYFTLLGELYKNIDNKKAKMNFIAAYELAKTQNDKQTIQAKINSLEL